MNSSEWSGDQTEEDKPKKLDFVDNTHKLSIAAYRQHLKERVEGLKKPIGNYVDNLNEYNQALDAVLRLIAKENDV